MARAVRFAGGPLDGQVYMLPNAPSLLYVGRSVTTEGVLLVPAMHQGPLGLRKGVYRRSFEPLEASRGVYRFDEQADAGS